MCIYHRMNTDHYLCYQCFHERVISGQCQHNSEGQTESRSRSRSTIYGYLRSLKKLSLKVTQGEVN